MRSTTSRRRRRRLPTVSTVATLLLASFVVFSGRTLAQPPVGQFVDEAIFVEGGSLAEVSAGTMQLYMGSLRGGDIDAALGDPNVQTIVATGDVDDLYLDPVQNDPSVGGYNPFAIAEVRQAVQWLVDRDFIAEQILGGHAVAVRSPVHPLSPEYQRQVLFFQALEHTYGYNEERARDAIFAALDKVPGMTFGADGKWHYNGAPLTVHFIIHPEDYRLDVGNYVADQLERVGLTVVRDYFDQPIAFDIVYFGPPNLGKWHIYTERIPATGGIVRWDDAYFARVFIPYYSYSVFCPGACWPFEHDDLLVDAALRLEKGHYRDLGERELLVRTASSLAMRESIRIPTVSVQRTFVGAKTLTFAYDLGEGPLSPFAVRSARFASPGGQLRIGQSLGWVSHWNPVRGFWWPYDRAQLGAMADPGVTTHPHNGTYIPVRGAFRVTTSGGYGEPPLSVPSDAVWFNASRLDWQAVGTQVTAVSKVSWDLTLGTWHTGAAMSMADVMYLLSRYYRSYNESFGDGAINGITGQPIPSGDIGDEPGDPRAASPDVVRFLSLFKGAKVTGPTTLDVYLDFWQLEPGTIAAEADLFPKVPWEVEEAMVQVVAKDNLARYHATTAQRDGKVLLDLTRGPSLPLLRDALAALKSANEVPPGMGAMITPSDAAARWASLDRFSSSTTRVIGETGYSGGHFLASNGPAFLEAVDVGARETTLHRFDAYPYSADHWDGLLVPRVPTVTLAPAMTQVADPGEIASGYDATISVGTTLFGQPYDRVSLVYSVTNPSSGERVASGQPIHEAGGTWTIELNSGVTAHLQPGPYVVQVVAVGEEAAIPQFAEGTIVVIPDSVLAERMLGRLQADLQRQITETNEKTEEANRNALTAIDVTRSLMNRALVGIAVAAVSLAASIGCLLVPLRMTRAQRSRPTRHA